MNSFVIIPRCSFQKTIGARSKVYVPNRAKYKTSFISSWNSWNAFIYRVVLNYVPLIKLPFTLPHVFILLIKPKHMFIIIRQKIESNLNNNTKALHVPKRDMCSKCVLSWRLDYSQNQGLVQKSNLLRKHYWKMNS